ncbi:uncharacterized protein A4U43_C08F14270 [Asparagus officinalis]|nr:uncharacterized protein A4U43_C08F14270 [Asparagus officinalis]
MPSHTKSFDSSFFPNFVRVSHSSHDENVQRRTKKLEDVTRLSYGGSHSTLFGVTLCRVSHSSHDENVQRRTKKLEDVTRLSYGGSHSSHDDVIQRRTKALNKVIVRRTEKLDDVIREVTFRGILMSISHSRHDLFGATLLWSQPFET